MSGCKPKLSAFCGGLLVGAALTFGASDTATASADDIKSIREHMHHLRTLVGSWSADYEFHDKDGTVSVDPGSFTVSWVLDDTYLQIQAEHHNREDPSRNRRYTTFITYDPPTKKYVCTFFYGRSSLRVTEADGVFDKRSKELRTSALIPLENGTRDEHVREIYQLTGPDSATSFHYSQYNDEPTQRLDLVIKLRRSGQSQRP